MSIKPPKSVTVLVDTREQDPFLFPVNIIYYPDRYESSRVLVGIKTKRVALETGDYYLDGFDTVCGIERKKNLSEIATNVLTKDRRRFISALDRLANQFAHPYMVIEATHMDLYHPLQWRDPNQLEHEGDRDPPPPERVIDALMRDLTARNIHLITAGRCAAVKTRKQLGGHLVRRMLHHALDYLEP